MTPPSTILLVAALAATAPLSYADPSSVVINPLNSVDEYGGINLNTPPNEFVKNIGDDGIILSSSFPTPEVHSAFEAWKLDFDRSYKSISEHALRKVIWLQNHFQITSHNSRGTPSSYILKHNDFSDLTNDEFQQRFYLGKHSPGVVKPKGGRYDAARGGVASTARKLRTSEEDTDVSVEDEVDDTSDEDTVADVPESKNWKEDGAVTDVKNQWFCGA